VNERHGLSQLLVHIATTDGSPVPHDLVAECGNSIVHLPRACDRHGIVLAAHVALADVDVPPIVRDILSQRYRHGVIRHMLLSLELQRLGRLLDDAGLPWLVAKGPVVTETLYPRPDLRSYADLDLLVARPQFPMALAIIERAGGRLIEQDWREVLRLFKAELNLRFDSGALVDLHWSLLYDEQLRHQFRWHDAELLERRRYVDLGQGLMAPTLDPTDTLIHLAVHACLAGGHRLGWLRDIQLGAGADGVQWPQLLERARRFGVSLPVGVMLRRVRKTLGGATWTSAIERALLGEEGWARMIGLEERVRPPQSWHGELLSAHILCASTRADTGGSWATLRRHARDELVTIRSDPRNPWRRLLLGEHDEAIADAPVEAPDTSIFRASYLDAVAH